MVPFFCITVVFVVEDLTRPVRRLSSQMGPREGFIQRLGKCLMTNEPMAQERSGRPRIRKK
jgi:hypothetical protein